MRAFFPTFFDGTPVWLKRAAIAAVAYAWLFLLARWAWQLNDPDSTPPAPGDPELTAVAFAFYVLSAAVLAGVGKERGPGPRADRENRAAGEKMSWEAPMLVLAGALLLALGVASGCFLALAPFGLVTAAPGPRSGSSSRS